MLKKILVVISLVIGLSAILVLAGCSPGNISNAGTYPNGIIISTGTYPNTATTSTGTYKDVVITPTVTNDTVSIPVSIVISQHLQVKRSLKNHGFVSLTLSVLLIELLKAS